VTPCETKIAALLATEGPLSVAVIAGRLASTPNSVASALRLLEAEGLAEKRRAPGSRATRWAVTDAEAQENRDP
jgi:DNA-binding MarR family transcriptional regulator